MSRVQSTPLGLASGSGASAGRWHAVERFMLPCLCRMSCWSPYIGDIGHSARSGSSCPVAHRCAALVFVPNGNDGFANTVPPTPKTARPLPACPAPASPAPHTPVSHLTCIIPAMQAHQSQALLPASIFEHEVRRRRRHFRARLCCPSPSTTYAATRITAQRRRYGIEASRSKIAPVTSST